MAGKKRSKISLISRLASWLIVILMVLGVYLIFFTDTEFPFDIPDFNIPGLDDVVDVMDSWFPGGDSANNPQNSGNPSGDSPGSAQVPKDTGGGTMEVHVLDVGQGSSTLFVSGGYAILIDAGENGQGHGVVSYINSLGINSIDLMIGTHPHSDHIGGMDEVMEAIDVETIIMPALPLSLVPTTKTYLNVLEVIDSQGKTITEAGVGDTYQVGPMTLEIFGPVIAFSDLNNLSVISRISLGEYSVLVTGDAEKDAESAVLASFKKPSADIYVVSHHGSNTSSTPNFVDAVSPSYAAISCGAGNSYGHPHSETLQTLEIRQIPYYRTDYNGTIVFTINEDGITVECER